MDVSLSAMVGLNALVLTGGMADALRGATLLAATVTTGLSAGLFYTFSCSILPGLARTDDRTFISAMQEINVAILNGWFALAFFGAVVFTALTGALHLARDGHRPLPWIAAALVLYVAALVVTGRASLPLNDRLAAAGPVDRIADLAVVRARFEATWVRWNVARAALSTAAFGCLCWALVLHGRVTAG
jgi:uncharacterized membrane protein